MVQTNVITVYPTTRLHSTITRGCIRCHKKFEYKVNPNEKRGSRTRKYCNHCIILQHADESRAYQRVRRQKIKIKKKERYTMNKERIQKIIDEVNDFNPRVRVRSGVFLNQEQCDQILDKVLRHKEFELKILTGQKSKSIASGIIEIVCRKNKIDISPEYIAREMNLSSTTVRHQSKKIQELLKIKLKDKRYKKKMEKHI